MSDTSVLSAGLVTLGSTVASNVMPTSVGGQGQLPPVRLLFGTSLAFAGLSMLDEFEPLFASRLAWLLAFTAFTYYGLPIADNYFNQKHGKTGPSKLSVVGIPKDM